MPLDVYLRQHVIPGPTVHCNVNVHELWYGGVCGVEFCIVVRVEEVNP